MAAPVIQIQFRRLQPTGSDEMIRRRPAPWRWRPPLHPAATDQSVMPSSLTSDYHLPPSISPPVNRFPSDLDWTASDVIPSTRLQHLASF